MIQQTDIKSTSWVSTSWSGGLGSKKNKMLLSLWQKGKCGLVSRQNWHRMGVGFHGHHTWKSSMRAANRTSSDMQTAVCNTGATSRWSHSSNPARNNITDQQKVITPSVCVCVCPMHRWVWKLSFKRIDTTDKTDEKQSDGCKVLINLQWMC